MAFLILQKQSYTTFYLIRKYKSIDKCLDHIQLDEKKSLIQFYDELTKIDFFSLQEDPYPFSPFDDIPGSGKSVFYLHLTHRCNLKCNYCFNKHARNNFHDLSFEKWKNIIDKIIDYSHTIILTGGEPTLNKSFIEIVNYIKTRSSSLSLEIITNGCRDFEKEKINDILLKFDAVSLVSIKKC